MRVGIVNDVWAVAEALRRLVARMGQHEVVWVAHDGREAVEKCVADRPDVVLMDLVMPVMDGVEATREIMRQAPCAILIVTAKVEGNAPLVFKAMGYGALDVVGTPTRDLDGTAPLLAKLSKIATLTGKQGHPQVASTLAADVPSYHGQPAPLALIGCSAGGPKALQEVFAHLPSSFATAILVVQHVDAQFAPGFAAWLGDQAPFPVEIAAEGCAPKPGTALLAATNDHLVMQADLRLHYTPEPLETPYRPSVDALFESVARHWPDRGTGVLLTGMGSDGAVGLLALKRLGWHTIAQDQETSVIYGMPKAAAELDAAVEILPLSKIARALADQMIRRERLPQPVRRPETP